ncbi:MAG: class I SAM-dependent methyltransferase [Oscillospiraceae bacterium]
MYTNPPKLTPRLQKIADMITHADAIADIGTDHAYLPVYLCMKGFCKIAIASDIRKGPVARAIATVKKYEMCDKIQVRLGAGLDTIKSDEVSAIVIAGMGGLMIAEILDKGSEILKSLEKIIIQPMTHQMELRKYLIKNGYTIVNEALAKEESKIYNIMEIKFEKSIESFTESDYYIGKKSIFNNDEFFDEYFSRKLDSTKKIALELKKSTADDSKLKIKTCESLLNELLKY